VAVGAAAAAFTPSPLTALPGSESFPTFSPDGSQVAFTWVREGGTGTDVYAQAIGTGTPLRLTNDDSLHMYPAWSPDGSAIAAWHVPRGTTVTAVTTQGRLVLVPPLGGPERQVLEWTGAARRISWSPDGHWLAISPVSVRTHRERGITLVSPATGQRIEGRDRQGVRGVGRPGVLAGRRPPRLHEDPRRLLVRRLPGRGRRRRQAGRRGRAAADGGKERASRCGRRMAATCW
jgi:dipeptidyl aminopeptidase/acylaminoacyl peptidase